MKAAYAIGAIGALAVGTTALAEPVVVPVTVGTFMNAGNGAIHYWGDYGEYVWSSPAPGKPDHTLIRVEIADLLTSLDLGGFVGVSVLDTGLNLYGPFSPGADLDFVALADLSPGIDAYFDYEGPNQVHSNESPGLLAYRVGEIDSESGHQDAWDWTHVSLGEFGRLDMMLTEPQPTLDIAHPSPTLLLTEVGSFETFSVGILAVVPAPGTLALLALAGLVARPPRRRKR